MSHATSHPGFGTTSVHAPVVVPPPAQRPATRPVPHAPQFSTSSTTLNQRQLVPIKKRPILKIAAIVAISFIGMILAVTFIGDVIIGHGSPYEVTHKIVTHDLSTLWKNQYKVLQVEIKGEPNNLAVMLISPIKTKKMGVINKADMTTQHGLASVEIAIDSGEGVYLLGIIDRQTNKVVWQKKVNVSF